MNSEALRTYAARRAATGASAPFGTADPVGLFTVAGWAAVTPTAPGGPGANFGRLPAVPGGLIPGAPHLVAARTGVSAAKS
jgi:hypothetical protein